MNEHKRLSDRQVVVLNQLFEANEKASAIAEDLKYNYEEARWKAFTGVRELIRDCRDFGIPYRDIYKVLGTSDYRTVKAYERDERPNK